MKNILRPEKGKSLLNFPDDYCLVDIETTGLDPNYDEIIEISALKIKNNNIIDSFSTLVKPYEEINEFITKLTGITNEMLESAPRLKTILPNFIDFINNEIIIGHNINFDINFLYDNSLQLLNKPLTNDFIDTLRISRRILPDLKNHKLSTLAEHYNIDYSKAHRSLDDCNITYQLYNDLKLEALNKFDSLDNFYKTFQNQHYNIKISEIKTDNTEFDVSHPLYNKICVFTGTLDKMPRKEAMQIVVNSGGICANAISSKTNYLIMGNTAYAKNVKDGITSKMKKARELQLNGADIEIITENIFYDLISN